MNIRLPLPQTFLKSTFWTQNEEPFYTDSWASRYPQKSTDKGAGHGGLIAMLEEIGEVETRTKGIWIASKKKKSIALCIFLE